MNRTEVRDLLTLIEGFEGRPFPASAVDAWLLLLARVEQADAIQAVREHFDSAEVSANRVQPGQIKRRAIAIREVRERAERRALPAPTQGTPPNQAYLRARQRLAERFGDLNRVTARPPMRADASSPTTPDSGITDDARRRAQAALRAMAA